MHTRGPDAISPMIEIAYVAANTRTAATITKIKSHFIERCDVQGRDEYP
jgi:hypothetical protein